MSFFFYEDFAPIASGTFREATPEEEIAQDVTHLLSELDAPGQPATASFMNELQSKILELLSSHPRVNSIEDVQIRPDDTNVAAVTIHVNNSPLAITAGGR
ncbi:hypothetical protein J7643_19155 [bacterium]|nr:hypothetical protein [bacterium]